MDSFADIQLLLAESCTGEQCFHDATLKRFQEYTGTIPVDSDREIPEFGGYCVIAWSLHIMLVYIYTVSSAQRS